MTKSKINVSVVATQESLAELKILRASLEKYHDVTWNFYGDDYVRDYVKGNFNVDIFIPMDRGEILRKEQEKHPYVTKKLVQGKLVIIEECLKKFGRVINLDTDMIFFNPINEKYLNCPSDALLTPHYTSSPILQEVGYYNAGMIFLNGFRFFEKWKEVTLSEKYFYEQKPLEIVKNMNCCDVEEVDGGHNFGTGRRNEGHYKELKIIGDRLYWRTLPLVNFHLHLFDHDEGYLGKGTIILQKYLRKNMDRLNPELTKLLKEEDIFYASWPARLPAFAARQARKRSRLKALPRRMLQRVFRPTAD